MRRHRRVRAIAQLMLQGLGEGLHTRLGDIIGRIAWRCRDPLLRAGIDHQSRPPGRHHVGHKGLSAIDDAPQIGVEHDLPIGAIQD